MNFHVFALRKNPIYRPFLISISEKYEEIYRLHKNLPNIFVREVSLSIINQFNLPDSF